MYTFARHVLTGHFIYLFIYIVKKEKKKRVVANSTSIFCFVCFSIYYVFNGMLNWLPKCSSSFNQILIVLLKK